MAVGKNKRLTKSKKGAKGKKIIDPFKNKQKYEVFAPSYFPVRNVGTTICSKTTGNKIASENLKNRVVPVNLADLKNDEAEGYRIMKLRVEHVQERRCLTQFHGLQLTTDKLRSLVRKWQTLIETNVDVKTSDGFMLRVFVIAFTSKRPNQARKTFYAQASQVRQIRKKMNQIIRSSVAASDLKSVVDKFVLKTIEGDIESATNSVYPLQNVFIRKVKMLKTPKFDLNRLMEVHGDTAAIATAPVEDTGAPAEEPAEAVVGADE